MVSHVKYNNRFDSIGNVFCDWFTVGDTCFANGIEVTVDSIHIDWQSNSADIMAHDEDNKNYVIHQQNIHQVINEL